MKLIFTIGIALMCGQLESVNAATIKIDDRAEYTIRDLYWDQSGLVDENGALIDRYGGVGRFVGLHIKPGPNGTFLSAVESFSYSDVFNNYIDIDKFNAQGEEAANFQSLSTYIPGHAYCTIDFVAFNGSKVGELLDFLTVTTNSFGSEDLGNGKCRSYLQFYNVNSQNWAQATKVTCHKHFERQNGFCPLVVSSDFETISGGLLVYTP